MNLRSLPPGMSVSRVQRKRDFLKFSHELLDEMNLLNYLDDLLIGYSVLKNNILNFRTAVFSLVLATNILILLNTEGPGGDGYPFDDQVITKVQLKSVD